MTKYCIDESGAYLGAFACTEVDGKVICAAPPAGSIDVGVAPTDARQVWVNGQWSDPIEVQ